jgi:hypothetical protein
MIPFPDPENRSQARANAMHYARLVEKTVIAGAPFQPGQVAVLKAQMWAQVAQAFPEGELDHIVLMGDDQPVRYQDQDVAEVRPLDDQDGITVTVESRAWSVLRDLAVRYVRSSLTRSVALDSEDIAETEALVLRLHWMHSGSVRATTEDGSVVR